MVAMIPPENQNSKTGFEFLDKITESRIARILSVFILFVAALIFHMLVLIKFPHMSYGMDGAYYDLQVISILETGLPYHLDPPLVFYYQTVWALVLGNIPLGIKVGMAIFAALVAPTSFLFFKEISGKFTLSWIASFYLVFDPKMLALDNGFYKNLAGLALMFAFFYFYVRATRHESRKDLILAFVFLFATFLTHIFPSGLIVIGVSFHWLYCVARERKLWTTTTRTVVKLGVGLIGLFIVVLVIYPDAVSKFSKIISFTTQITDADSLGIENTDWLAFLIRPESLAIILILGMCTVGYHLLRNNINKDIAIIFGIGIAEIILCSPLIPWEWRWRFAMLMFIPTGFGVAYIISVIRPFKTPKKQTVFVIAIIVLVCSIQIVNGVQASQRTRPIIPPIAYNDLLYIAENNIIPDDGIVVTLTTGGLIYWIPLTQNFTVYRVISEAFETAINQSTVIYFILDSRSPSPPPFTSLNFTGLFYRVFVGAPAPP